jgi:APA family basic amino acid/polyamine antiporter
MLNIYPSSLQFATKRSLQGEEPNREFTEPVIESVISIAVSNLVLRKMVELKRTLNLLDATAIGVGAIIGAGIFVVLGIAVGYAGPAVIVSMVIAATVALFTALSFAELGSAIPRQGGTYEFAYQMISPFAAFISGCMWLFGQTVAGAAVSLGLASYVVAMFPFLSLKIVAISAALILTVLNLVGTKYSAVVNNVLVVVKILILCLFVGFGAFEVNSQNYTPFAPYGIIGILQAAGFIFFAYIGFGRIAALGEEVKNPKKTLPLAILLSLLIAVILYVATGLVATGLQNYRTLAGSGSPLADAARATGNSTLVAAIFFGAIIATVSVLLTNLLGLSRVSFAMARNGQLPRSLATIHSKLGTPYVSILMTGAIMAILVSVANLTQTAAITSLSLLSTHIILHISAIRLRKKMPNLKTFKAPFFPLIPCLGVASCIVLMFSLLVEREAWIVWAIVLVIVSVYYLLRNRH